MKRSCIAAAILAAIACTGSEDPGPAAVEISHTDSTNVEVAFGATVAVEGLLITFTSVDEDSRCPIDVTCVWAGNGRIALRIQHDATTLPITLNTTVEPRAREFGRHRIHLVSLEPQPRSDRPIPPADYRVRLTVTSPPAAGQ